MKHLEGMERQGIDRRSFLGSVAAAAGALCFAPAALVAQSKMSGGEAAYWKKIRAEFPLGPNEIFLNTGTLGCTPRVVIETMTKTLEDIAELPPINSGEFNRTKVPEVRVKVAKLFNATPAECTVTTSTTAGINISLLGLDWKPGDEILMSTHEHGGGINPSMYVAKRFGAKVVKFDLPTNPKSDAEVLQHLEDKITPRTRLILVSHIMYTTGYVAPIEAIGEIAKRRKLLFLVDAAHPAGLMPIDVKKMNVSFYSCAGHKWMCGPVGTGLLYVNANVLPTMHPISVGHVPDKPITEADHLHEWSNVPVAQIMGLGAAIDFHQSMGPARVFAHDVALINRFKRGLSQIPSLDLVSSYEGHNAGPVATVEIKNNMQCADVVKKLKTEHSVTIRTMVHKELPRLANTIRVSPHVYNNEEDIDRCLDGLKAIMKA